MVETFVNFRPREFWPRRVIRYPDAAARPGRRWPPWRTGVRRRRRGRDRDSLVNDAAQKALERFDEVMRELALRRYAEFEGELGPVLARFAVADTVRRMRAGGHLGD